MTLTIDGFNTMLVLTFSYKVLSSRATSTACNTQITTQTRGFSLSHMDRWWHSCRKTYNERVLDDAVLPTVNDDDRWTRSA